MIEVTRLNGEVLILNAELIEKVEATPDTVITLTTGRKVVVCETLSQLVARVLDYRRAVAAGGRP